MDKGTLAYIFANEEEKKAMENEASIETVNADLLAALENMLEWLDRTGESRSAGGMEYEYVTEARLAIRRARGVSA